MDPRVKIAPRYLSIEDQEMLMAQYQQHVETGPRKEVILNRYGLAIATVPNIINALVFWNAGFKGYGLRRYARGRVATIALPCVGAVITGPSFLQMFGYYSLMDTWRTESQLYYGLKFATIFQYCNLTSAAASVLITFIYATRNGVLLVPRKKYIFKIPVDAYVEIFKRLKPYRYSLLASWVGSTAFGFALGVGSYNESCKILRERFGRQTLSLVEEA